MAAPRLVTAEELERMVKPPVGDFELVRGRLVPVSPAGGEHGVLAGFLVTELGGALRRRNAGRIYTETGFVLARHPDLVRAPDVSVVMRDRPAGIRAPRGFIEGPPDLAIEIRSPDNTKRHLFQKSADYLRAGARLVWIVEPRTRNVHVHRRDRAPVVLAGGDILDGEDVLPGFQLEVARLFAELD